MQPEATNGALDAQSQSTSMSTGSPSLAERCQFCGRGREVESVCGTLHVADVSEGEQGSKKWIAHHRCLQYSALLVQYVFAHFGGFKIDKVIKEVNRGRFLKCDICKKKKKSSKIRVGGATGGCAIKRCGKTYHFYCAKTNNDVLTRRMVKKGKDGKKQVLYRVFCNQAHLELYLKQEENVGLICQSDTDSDTEEAGSVPATGGASSSSSDQDQAMSPASDTSSLSDPNSSHTEDFTADTPSVPLVTVIGTITSVLKGQPVVHSATSEEEVFGNQSSQGFNTSDQSDGNDYTEGGERRRQLLPLALNDGHNEAGKQLYCYCGEKGEWYMKMLQCRRCHQWFHEACIKSVANPLMFGDRFYVFVCYVCNKETEYSHRLQLTWADVVQLVLFHLTIERNVKYHDVHENIIPYVEKNLDILQLGSLATLSQKERKEEIEKALCAPENTSRFKNGKEIKKKTTLYGLRKRGPPVPPEVVLPPGGEVTDLVLDQCQIIPATEHQNDTAPSRGVGRPKKRQTPSESEGGIRRNLKRAKLSLTKYVPPSPKASTASSADESPADEQESQGYDGGGQEGAAEGRGHQRRAKVEGQARRAKSEDKSRRKGSIKGKDPNKQGQSKGDQRPGTDKPGKNSKGAFPVCKKPKINSSSGGKESPDPSGRAASKEGDGEGVSGGGGLLLPWTTVTGSDKPSKALAPRRPSTLSLTSEDTDTSLRSANHNKHRASYVLCIGDGALERDNMAALHHTAKEKFDVVSEAVLLWPIKGPSLTTMQTLFFMVDVTNSVKDSMNKKASKLDKMVFQSDEKLVSDYESKVQSLVDLGLSHTKYQEMKYQEIQTIFAALEAECGSPVGCLVQEDSLRTRVLYLLLSDITDPACHIRSRLISVRRLVYRWPEDVVLQPSEAPPTKEEASWEAHTIRKHLKNLSSGSRVYTYPCEPYLCAKNECSATSKVFRYCVHHISKDSACPNVVIFIGPVDHSVIVYKVFARKCIENMLEEHLADDGEVVVVLDIGHDLGVVTHGDMLPPLADDIYVKVWTALNPRIEAPSCALLHFCKTPPTPK